MQIKFHTPTRSRAASAPWEWMPAIQGRAHPTVSLQCADVREHFSAASPQQFPKVAGTQAGSDTCTHVWVEKNPGNGRRVPCQLWHPSARLSSSAEPKGWATGRKPLSRQDLKNTHAGPHPHACHQRGFLLRPVWSCKAPSWGGPVLAFRLCLLLIF